MVRVAELELHDEVVEWMDALDHAEWDRTVVVIDRLVSFVSSARMPLSRGLGDGLFELRFSLAKGRTCVSGFGPCGFFGVGSRG